MSADVKRRSPLHLAVPTNGEPSRDRLIADALLQVTARVNAIDEDVIDVKVAVIRIEKLLRGQPADAAQKIDPDSSYNVLSVEMNRAAALLYAQAKDPSNPMTMADVIAVARGVVAQAKHDSDASKLKKIETSREKWRDRWWKILLLIIGAIASAFAGRYGLK